MTAAIAVTFVVRCVMVLIFLPFSALDKLLGFGHAVGQAQEVFRPRWLARAVILAGLAIEVACSIGVVTGISDRAAACVIAGYCFATAVLFKPFWKPGDFWPNPDGQARGLFWDFLKNLALGAGFLLLVAGTDGSGLQPFLDAPFASSQPYRSP
ncbi:DoxX family membrane protein [Acidovorax sp. PRC11]|uniref:DoxX family membrane protein n=1 Tax=Acidovorax sp. PRC11 TaxID=2962592 RepID=UPI002882C1E3|nr:DoxX family membrane protein [Acidovorax sp. PRC11]MDT0137997.1 DoxX family membrane protein [Acidovorax sp. PRC11]